MTDVARLIEPKRDPRSCLLTRPPREGQTKVDHSAAGLSPFTLAMRKASSDPYFVSS